MEKIINNPGLQHLAENVLWNLDVKYLKMCAQINQSCKFILQNPIFCLRKFEHLSKENRKDWIKVIHSNKNSENGIAIISYLQWSLKKEASIDLPCYTRPEVQDDFRKKIFETSVQDDFRKKILESSRMSNLEIVKIIAPLTDNPNAPDEYRNTPIFWAAFYGNTEIVKILAPFIKIDSSNVQESHYLLSSIFNASWFGFTEILELLALMIDNPNAKDEFGRTLIYRAAKNGYAEFVKILAPLTDNPNTPDENGNTPIYWAARNECTEIVKILAPLTNNPNAPNASGITPSATTKNEEIHRILKSFSTSRKCN